ncbi:hypothetical protein ACFWA5_50855 [Streptomyces mirabilis]|uniref:hypothetical protein n=1 Tax=Streptomyces mirabilis TaxID=68239 RepID=UPI003654BEC8
MTFFIHQVAERLQNLIVGRVLGARGQVGEVFVKCCSWITRLGNGVGHEADPAGAEFHGQMFFLLT